MTSTRCSRERFGSRAFTAGSARRSRRCSAAAGAVLLVAPTGGGKSLCYQLPAVALDGTTLVISPLIALMEDQVRALEARGIPATFLASTLDARGERAAPRGAACAASTSSSTPRPSGSRSTGSSTRSSATLELSLVAIDEAHCIVQWGHDFRPDYLRIGDAHRAAPPAARPRLHRDRDARRRATRSCARLGSARRRRRRSSCAASRARTSHLAVREVDGPKRRASARCATRSTRARHAAARRAARRSSTRRRASAPSSIAEQLAEARLGRRARTTQASPPRRARRSRTRFADAQAPRRRRDERVRHGHRSARRARRRPRAAARLDRGLLPGGRPRRARRRAGDGLLLLAPARHRAAAAPVRARAATAAPATAARAARAWALFRELLRYVDAATCRHDFILRYFGDEAESLGGCGHCDVCLARRRARARRSRGALARDADVVRRALAGVARAQGRGGDAGGGRDAVRQVDRARRAVRARRALDVRRARGQTLARGAAYHARPRSPARWSISRRPSTRSRKSRSSAGR